MKKRFMRMMSGFLVVGALLPMAGCGLFSPKLNIDDAEDALEERNYEVEIERDADFEELEGIIVKALYAEKGDDEIVIFEGKNKKTIKLLYEMEKASIEAEIAELNAMIEVYEHIVSDYDDILKSAEIDALEDEIKELKEEVEDCEKELACIGISGVYIWRASSEDVIKDAQGK